jgi:hypothetical protein
MARTVRANRLRVVPGVTERRLRSEFGDDRHAGECASCAYYDTYRQMFGMNKRVAKFAAEHIRTSHEPAG